jgi:beta-lactamase class A
MQIIPRRLVLLGLASLTATTHARAQDFLSELERRHGGRLGVAFLDTQTNRQINHRASERFAMCSTFKFLLASLVLSRIDHGQEQRNRRIIFTKRLLVDYSPITETHLGAPGMSIEELCEAAVTLSDNTAANLLLASVGGPPAVTSFARSLGDTMTRLDRTELDLNDVGPGDPRDTTTPDSMLANLQKILLGNALSPASRARITAWMIASKTGGNRLRAGLPPGWRVADKTGTGRDTHNAVNDIAVIWLPHRAPLIVTAYYYGSEESLERREAVLAKAASFISSL